MAVLAFTPRPAPDRPCAKLHIWREGDSWELHHESRTGDSWALLDRFTTREAALRAALDALPLYADTKLGEVAA